jgi:D-sedoheptulose 7-phosphate isomerase
MLKEGVLKKEVGNVVKAASFIIGSLDSGGKVLVFGNGGSASDAQHIAAELVGRFKKERMALPAIALGSNSSIITAIANDYGYDMTFSRQVEALGGKKVVALGISTSGNSANVLEAIKKARSMGMKTIGLLGSGGGRISNDCDIAIVIDSSDTPRIQEAHITIGHIICGLVEDSLFRRNI